MTTPRLGLLHGDPAGIGPELAAKLLTAGERPDADFLLIGDAHVFEMGADQAGVSLPLTMIDAPDRPRGGAVSSSAASIGGASSGGASSGGASSGGASSGAAFGAIPSRALPSSALPSSALPPSVLPSGALPSGALPALDLGITEPGEVPLGAVSEAGGRSVLRSLDRALDLARDGTIDGILFAPFNKASMHMADLGHEDEIQYMKAYLGIETRVSEFNTMDGLWTARVTSHIPLRDVADNLDEDLIVEAIRLTDRELRRVGIARPRIAVAALNPHAGDNGNFGTEEIDIIAPAVERAAREQIHVDGPWPSDTVFLRWTAREVDAVVTMYHDQGQIALKLLGFNRGVTVQGGLPFPVGTPAHGTAFDIAGKGIADPGATLAACGVIASMARRAAEAPVSGGPTARGSG